MRYRTGLFRMWVVVSVLWLCFQAWNLNIPCLLGFDYSGAKPWCKGVPVYPLELLAETTTVLFSLPLLSGLMLLCCFWIVDGFRRG